MPWAKLDDSWDDCDLLNGATDAAVALFLRTQARMARQMTDGILHVADLERLELSRPDRDRRRTPWRRVIAELVERGIYLDDGARWRDPRWLERNPSREEIEAQRAYDAIRQRIRFARGTHSGAELEAELATLRIEEEAARRARNVARDRRRAAAASHGENAASHTVSHGVTHNAPARPVPSRPVRDEGRGRDAREDSSSKRDDERAPTSGSSTRPAPIDPMAITENWHIYNDPASSDDARRVAEKFLVRVGEIRGEATG